MIKNNQSGRSMIEMLGVLAIIGVLSVGGIAGYTKAMSMYKSSKQLSQLNQMFFAITQNAEQFRKLPTSVSSLAEILIKLK